MSFEYIEWIDPLTEETHACPKNYISGLLKCILVGGSNAKTASELLENMGHKSTESNKRHLRKASFYLRKSGIPVISVRSAKGGYFIAQSKEEVAAYTESQRKLAQSMLTEANILDTVDVTSSLEKFSSLKG